MEAIYKINNNAVYWGVISLHDVAKSLFLSIHPSYFKEDCYNTDNVEFIVSPKFDQICNIMSVVTSNLEIEDLLKQLHTKVFGEVAKPFFYLDLNIVKFGYSLPQMFIINKIIEECYSMLLAYIPFKRFAEKFHIIIPNNDSSVSEKAEWLTDIVDLFRNIINLSTISDMHSSQEKKLKMMYIEMDSLYMCVNKLGFSEEKEVFYSELNKEDFSEFFCFPDLDNTDRSVMPLTKEDYWDQLIYSTTQENSDFFDYAKYIDSYNSIKSIKDIINLFDSELVMESYKSLCISKEELWSAMIYDAIYHSYITTSFFSFDSFQTSFKMMCDLFYSQYVIPSITENSKISSFFDIFFDTKKPNISTEPTLTTESYRKILYAFRKYCESRNNVLVKEFAKKIKTNPKNTHFNQAPEFYETILFYIILYYNLINNKYTNTNCFQNLYRESVGLDNMKQPTDDTIFKYEVGWYLINLLINYEVNEISSFDNKYDSTRNPTKMLFAFRTINSASHTKSVENKDPDRYDEMVYVISLIILKTRYCCNKKYEDILSSIKSIIIHSQTTSTSKLKMNFTDYDLTELQKYSKEKNRIRRDTVFTELRNIQGNTVDRIRILLDSPNAIYTKKQIMTLCNRSKSSVEKALYTLITAGEVKCFSIVDNKEKTYVRNYPEVGNFFKKISEFFSDILKKCSNN